MNKKINTVINITVSILISFISLYVLLAFVYYEVKLRKQKNFHFTAMLREKKYKFLSKAFCLIAALLSTIFNTMMTVRRYLTFQAMHGNAGMEQNYEKLYWCQFVSHSIVSLYVLSYSSVILFFWCRQRIFYSKASLSILNNRTVRYVSTASLIVWFFLFLIPSHICYYAFVKHEFDNNSGCSFSKQTSKKFCIILVVFVLVNALMHIILLALFVYPISKRQKLLRRDRATSNVFKRVTKAIIFAVIFLFSDFFTVVVVLGISVSTGFEISLFFNINLTIHLFLVIASFDRWRKMLFPWKVTSK